MSTHREGTERWQGNQREDGLTVVEGLDGYVIMPQAEGLPIDKCPCCDKPFPRTDRGARAARLVADAVYPVARRDQ
jgi:hypothetical protein